MHLFVIASRTEDNPPPAIFQIHWLFPANIFLNESFSKMNKQKEKQKQRDCVLWHLLPVQNVPKENRIKSHFFIKEAKKKNKMI